MKILVVDDDRGTRNALKVCLVSFGHEVVTARNGAQALTIFETLIHKDDPIELLLTDLMMPGGNGMDLIRSVRKLTPAINTIVMTAYSDGSVRNELSKLDGCGYIEKPFEPDRLLQVMAKLCRR